MPPKGDCVQEDKTRYPNDMAWSRHFQWLPLNVNFESRGEGASRYMRHQLLSVLPTNNLVAYQCRELHQQRPPYTTLYYVLYHREIY